MRESLLLMSRSIFRSLVCCWLALLVPAQMLGGEAASAMLYTTGSAWLNGSQVPKSAAVFSGDMLQTRRDSTANIQASGSSVMVMANSLVKFEGPAVELEHGGVRVTTSRSLAAHVGDVTIKPAGNSWTEFQVVDLNGQVQIAANKGDVTVQDDKGTTTVTQGEQTTRDDTSDSKKRKKRNQSGAAPAATGGIMSSKAAIITGSAIVGGAAAWVWLDHGGEGPISPSCRSYNCQ